MNIKFDEKTIQEYKELYNFLAHLADADIKTFIGNLGKNNLPYGLCTITLKSANTTIKKLSFTLNGKGELFGPATATLPNNKNIVYDFMDNDVAEVKYPNDGYYIGPISNFLRHGQGSYVNAEGIEMEGEFVNDFREGEFLLRFKDGEKCKAKFKNDKLNGILKKKLAEKKLELTATYRNGKLVDAEYNLLNANPGGKVKYKMISNIEDIFYNIKGDFEIYYNNELSYSGPVNCGKKEGKGILYLANEEYFQGYFKDNKKNGFGTIYDANGKVKQKGFWKNDEYIGEKEEVTNVVSISTNSALPSLTVNDQYDIIKIKEALKNIENNIVGQENAINQIANNLLLAFLCEREENKPLSSILMTGPTGVGKTETAKQISKHLFGKTPYVVDFSNFFGEHMLASLIGAPSGYKGYDEEPALLKYIKDNEKTGGVILFDELDKADEECYNIFMRMLDEGEIISAKNIPYNLNNFVIISTTNMSANHTRKLGFSKSNDNDIKDSLVKNSTGLKKEQVARYSLVVEYQPLSRENKITLCKNAIKSTIEKVKGINSYNIEFDINDEIVGKIVDNTNESFGVREIKNQASKAITSKLAEFIRKSGKRNLLVKINSLDDVEIVVKEEKSLKDLTLEK